MNQYLEQWVGKELTKELEEGIINAPQDLLGSHIYKEPGVQIFTAYRPCAWNVWLLDGCRGNGAYGTGGDVWLCD